MNQKAPNPIEFHNQIAADFSRQYLTDKAFLERKKVWFSLIDQYRSQVKRALDVGSGPGHFSLYMASLGFDVLGIDGSEKMLDLARSSIPPQFQGTLRFEKISIPWSDWMGGTFDLISVSSVLEYIDEYDKALDQLSSILNPGGILLISLPNKQSWFRTFEKWRYNLTGRPMYLSHVRTISSPGILAEDLQRRGITLKETVYYGNNHFLYKGFRWIVPFSKLSSLFVSVFQKTS